MKLANETLHPAALYRGELRPGLMHAAVLTRVRYRCDRHGKLAPVLVGEPDALTELRSKSVEDDYGVLEADIPFPRAATDVIIFADAAAPRPTQSMTVGVRVGPYQQSLLVTGDRTWQRGPRGLVPSAPQPFERMPLTYSRAYGGKARSSHGELANPSNPLGRGYYLDEASAVDNPLPNIEDPRHPIKRWVGTTRANFTWTVEHGLALCDEYVRRFGTQHRSRPVLETAQDRSGRVAHGPL